MGCFVLKLCSTLVALALVPGATAGANAGPREDVQAASEARKRGDFATALRLLRPLADQRYVLAETMLADMYLLGQGTPKNYAEALKLFQSAADFGWWPAQARLGFMYEQGRGVPVDLTKAEQLYRSAADEGVAYAQVRLGGLYLLGKGLPRNYVLAHMWFNLAAAAGNELAKEGRDLVERRMTASQLAEAQKLARDWKPKTDDSETETNPASNRDLFARSAATPPASASPQERAACFSKYTKYDVCSKAKEMHGQLVPLLPMRVSANMTLNQAFVAGPAISLLAIWHIDNADLRATLKANGMSDADLKLKMDQQSKTMVCGQQFMGAFIRLGGKMHYIYRTQDGVPVHSTTVDSCPVQ